MMRAVVVVIAMLALCSCSEPAPMPEYAAAMAKYQETVAKTLDPSHQHQDFAVVARMLREVPKRNKREHARAQQLAEMIEKAQAERAQFLAKVTAPLPEGALAPTSSPPIFEEPPPPSAPPPPQQDVKKSMDDCIKDLNKNFESCLKSCDESCEVQSEGSFNCKVKPEKREEIAKCVKDCQPKEVRCKP
jgi:hypothetical protein